MTSPSAAPVSARSHARALSSLRARDARKMALDLWKRNALVEASAMAFSLFLASIPLLALAGIVLSHVLRNESQALWLVSSFVDLAPDEVRSLVDGNIVRGTDESIAPYFLVGSLYLAAGAFHDAMTVFENALGIPPRRWLVKRAIAMGCVLVLLTLFAVAGWVVVSLVQAPFLVVTRVLELARQASPRLMAFFIAAIVSVALVSAFFWVAVRRNGIRPVAVPGAVVTVAIGSLTSLVFATYARSLANYAAFYGSLAAVTVFLVWLWLCCIALLIGAEVNAHLRKTAEE
jgi:membrane protein